MHRDIKPDNLMFRTKGKNLDLVLIDFGLSSFDWVKEYLYRRCGTPGFVAPEIIMNKTGE